jgi:HD-like signal output (HDOD) protein
VPVPQVIHFKPRSREEALAREQPRVLAAFGVALARVPPKPAGLGACVGYLQESVQVVASRQMALRALGTLRDSLFTAAGRDAEMALLWREALATACYARVVAGEARFDAPLLTQVGLLHRAGEIAALRALAQAEQQTGQRLVGPVMQEIFDAGDDELASRVTRGWGLPGEVRLAIIRWREEQESLARPLSVTLLMFAQALATELVHAATCTPGLVEAARDALRLPQQLAAQARAATSGIQALLQQLAPLPA